MFFFPILALLLAAGAAATATLTERDPPVPAPATPAPVMPLAQRVKVGGAAADPDEAASTTFIPAVLPQKAIWTDEETPPFRADEAWPLL